MLAASDHLEQTVRNPLKDKWAAGEETIGGWLAIADAFSAEIMGRVGFDYLCIDMQHGVADYATAIQMLQALEAAPHGVPIVRVPWNEPGIIGRMLDGGARGVIVPMVNTVAEAEAAVAACRYAPAGARSWGPVRAMRIHDEYSPELANQAVAVVPMIETRQALANLDEILSVPGIDAIYVGPADLSVSLGLAPASDHEGEFTDALVEIVAACGRHGVVPGVHTNPVYIDKRRAQGFQMITVCIDYLAMGQGAKDMLQSGTPGGETAY